MNLPNKLTVLRVCMVPVFVFLMLWSGLGSAGKYAAAAIFILASVTDWLDGYLARKYHLVTDFGKFMDPIADKLLVGSALICLVEKGDLAPIRDWMRENIWQHGCLYTPAVLMEKAFGGKFDAAFYVDYLKEKFTEIYAL